MSMQIPKTSRNEIPNIRLQIKGQPPLDYHKNGVGIVKCTDWEDLAHVFSKTLLNYPQFIFRGQSRARWKLRSNIDRAFLNTRGVLPTKSDAEDVLKKFKYATRGRLSSDWVPSDENSWWALGQHFGLGTPLLDFTLSPYVAAYFAFIEEAEVMDGKYPDRGIFAFDPDLLQDVSTNLPSGDRVEIINPLLDQNPRLVNQRGLFVKLPVGMDMERWVTKNYADKEDSNDSHTIAMIKIVIPEKEGHRDTFLRFLNRANINALTLFPDLIGASMHTNNIFMIENYE